VVINCTPSVPIDPAREEYCEAVQEKVWLYCNYDYYHFL
jgi:hypothetical protein